MDFMVRLHPALWQNRSGCGKVLQVLFLRMLKFPTLPVAYGGGAPVRGEDNQKAAPVAAGERTDYQSSDELHCRASFSRHRSE